MIYVVSGGFHTSGYVQFNFKWETSGEWVLAANGAFLARGLTQAAGDNVHFFSNKSTFRWYVYGEPRRKIQIDQLLTIKLAKKRIKKVTTKPLDSF